MEDMVAVILPRPFMYVPPGANVAVTYYPAADGGTTEIPRAMAASLAEQGYIDLADLSESDKVSLSDEAPADQPAAEPEHAEETVDPTVDPTVDKPVDLTVDKPEEAGLPVGFPGVHLLTQAGYRTAVDVLEAEDLTVIKGIGPAIAYKAQKAAQAIVESEE